MSNSLPLVPIEAPSYQRLANAIRMLSADAVQKAQSGHPGMPMGMADVATVLFESFLRFDPQHPKWMNRDRFVLSAGHGSMLLYSLLYLTGYEEMPLEEIKNFRQLGSKTAGHPEYGYAAGIETTTGPLGQGLATAVGMALAERMLNATYGDTLVNHKTYVLASDGDLMEGISHEAISFAGHYRLGNLIVLFDDNEISIDGPTSLSVSDDQCRRFEACGWKTYRIDGHDIEAIKEALEAAQSSDRPVLIACRTTIGFGAPNKQGTCGVHGSPLGEAEVAAVRKTLDWPYPPFEIPSDILAEWRAIGAKGSPLYKAWEEKFKTLSPQTQRDFNRQTSGTLPENFKKLFEDLKASLAKDQPAKATRQLSQIVLDTIAEAMPELVGGSADLTPSNNTKARTQTSVSASSYSGHYIHFGVREHGMSAIMNGLALHGGFIPYGGTFLIFTDYARPAIRLSALMEQGVIYVMTHDSIGLGEDGPTHQPIEQLSSLRAIPNLHVMRPADGVEVAECWQIALESRHTPSVIALTRQNIKPFRESAQENLSAKGGYIARFCEGTPKVTLMATGSEVGIALDVQALLNEKGIGATVVSLPCWKLFDQQPATYCAEVLGQGTLRVAIEAASPHGWHKYVGQDGLIFGLETFGASAPYEDLYRHFGLSADIISDKIIKALS